jgi:hypothetical protein
VVAVTAVIPYVPLNVASTPATTTESPTAKLWFAKVVRVATLDVKALFTTDAVGR